LNQHTIGKENWGNETNNGAQVSLGRFMVSPRTNLKLLQLVTFFSEYPVQTLRGDAIFSHEAV